MRALPTSIRSPYLTPYSFEVQYSYRRTDAQTNEETVRDLDPD